MLTMPRKKCKFLSTEQHRYRTAYCWSEEEEGQGQEQEDVIEELQSFKFTALGFNRRFSSTRAITNQFSTKHGSFVRFFTAINLFGVWSFSLPSLDVTDLSGAENDYCGMEHSSLLRRRRWKDLMVNDVTRTLLRKCGKARRTVAVIVGGTFLYHCSIPLIFIRDMW